MGEYKLPKQPLERPSAAIFAMRGSVAAAKSGVMGMDADTRDFMADLDRVISWIDHLERAKAAPNA